MQGKVRIQGSKNASLPILAATLLTEETVWLTNCPKIADVYCMVNLLESLGVTVKWEPNGIRINAATVCRGDMPADAVKGMRSSLCLLGALLGRCGEVVMEHPGGCIIGARPIDIHITALEQMGVDFTWKNGLLEARTRGSKLQGTTIRLPFPSVGATENIVMAAVMADGTTVIEGAAREPEVKALCEFLRCCGALIKGEGTTRITIKGTGILKGTGYRIPADRIVAGTYLLGTLAACGCVMLEEAPASEMEAVLETAEQMGACLDVTSEGVFVQACSVPRAISLIRTMPYPGFPTDLQSPVLAVLAGADGESMIEETIFENRFRVVEPLERMGANIEKINCNRVRIHGVERLRGTRMEAKELRGGAALLVAALGAEGESTITGCSYIYRGYENICKDFRELGARIVSV